MRTAMLDPTAGERARAIRASARAPQPILDPTDPHYHEAAPRGGIDAIEARRVLDPLDSECGDTDTRAWPPARPRRRWGGEGR